MDAHILWIPSDSRSCNPGHIVQSQYKPHLQRVQPWDTWACMLCPVLGLHHSYLYIPTIHPAPVTSFLGHSRKPGGAEGELAQESSFLCTGSKKLKKGPENLSLLEATWCQHKPQMLHAELGTCVCHDGFHCVCHDDFQSCFGSIFPCYPSVLLCDWNVCPVYWTCVTWFYFYFIEVYSWDVLSLRRDSGLLKCGDRKEPWGLLRLEWMYFAVWDNHDIMGTRDSVLNM